MASSFNRWLFASLAALGLLAELAGVQIARATTSLTCCYRRLNACTGCTNALGKRFILMGNPVTRCGNNGTVSTLCSEISQVCTVLHIGRNTYNAGCANIIGHLTKTTSYGVSMCQPIGCQSHG
jgi:hypothetical protein